MWLYKHLKKRYLFIIILQLLLIKIYWDILPWIEENSNPFTSHDICFRKDYPGAGDRFVTYTPVRCSNSSIVLGDAVGAEYATLTFKDIDSDRISEYIVSSKFWCENGLEPCADP